MGQLDTLFESLASTLVGQHGTQCALVRPTGDYDETQGTVEPGETTWDDVPCLVFKPGRLVGQAIPGNDTGRTVLPSDRRVMIAAKDIATTPQKTDKFRWRGIDHEVFFVRPTVAGALDAYHELWCGL